MSDISGLLKLTPTQRRMMAVLGNGQLHRYEKLRECLNDDLCEGSSAVRVALTFLRRKLRTVNRDVYYVIVNGKGYYRLIELPSLPAPIPQPDTSPAQV